MGKTQKKQTADKLAGAISQIFEATYSQLLDDLFDAYEAATAALDSEQETLNAEAATLDDAMSKLRELLPALTRDGQRKADEATLAGKPEEATAAFQEVEEAKAALASMIQRQREIGERITAIVQEDRAIATRIAKAWWLKCQIVTRASETGFLTTLLNGLSRTLEEFSKITHADCVELSRRALLSGPDSPEWKTGSVLYRTWGTAAPKVERPRW